MITYERPVLSLNESTDELYECVLLRIHKTERDMRRFNKEVTRHRRRVNKERRLEARKHVRNMMRSCVLCIDACDEIEIPLHKGTEGWETW
jgi:hypothetical protein